MSQCLWARLIRETAYRSPDTLGTLNDTHTILELVDDDAVSIEPVANNEQLYSWLACGDPDRVIGETETIEGTIRTLLYPAQAPLLLGWAFMPIVDGTPDTPWETDEPDGEFASMALDLGYRDDDGNARSLRLLGGKVTAATLSAARGTRQGAFMLELTARFSSTTTAGSTPDAGDYPTGAPYFLSSTSGNLSVNSSTISNYDSLSISAAYTVDARYDESTYVSRIRHRRREHTLTIGGILKHTPDWRALQTGRTAFSTTLAMNYPGGAGQQQISWDWGDNCLMREWSRSLPLGGARTQQAVILSQYDRDDDQTLTVAIGTQ